jgi:hypothetical protein
VLSHIVRRSDGHLTDTAPKGNGNKILHGPRNGSKTV